LRGEKIDQGQEGCDRNDHEAPKRRGGALYFAAHDRSGVGLLVYGVALLMEKRM
jgi:hypothetical protein